MTLDYFVFCLENICLVWHNKLKKVTNRLHQLFMWILFASALYTGKHNSHNFKD